MRREIKQTRGGEKEEGKGWGREDDAQPVRGSVTRVLQEKSGEGSPGDDERGVGVVVAVPPHPTPAHDRRTVTLPPRSTSEGAVATTRVCDDEDDESDAESSSTRSLVRSSIHAAVSKKDARRESRSAFKLSVRAWGGGKRDPSSTGPDAASSEWIES